MGYINYSLLVSGPISSIDRSSARSWLRALWTLKNFLVASFSVRRSRVRCWCSGRPEELTILLSTLIVLGTGESKIVFNFAESDLVLVAAVSLACDVVAMLGWRRSSGRLYLCLNWRSSFLRDYLGTLPYSFSLSNFHFLSAFVAYLFIFILSTKYVIKILAESLHLWKNKELET